MFKKNFTEEDKKAWIENKEAEIKDLEESLTNGISDIMNSQNYKDWLDMCSRFPRYSVNNQILIFLQTGGKASMVQSYGNWKKMGRTVKKGEQGIKIFAPAPYTIQKSRETGELDENGDPATEEVTIKRMSFKVTRVFDVSQTEGKDLPSLGTEELSGEVSGYSNFIEALKEVSDAPVSFENIEGGAKGFYKKDEHRIVVKEGMSEVQTIKTLLHEMTHSILHRNGSEERSKNAKEVEAESTAYIVCKHFGIDTSDYSFSYVAGWSSGKETEELKKSMDTIGKTAKDLITAIHERIGERTVEEEMER